MTVPDRPGDRDQQQAADLPRCAACGHRHNPRAWCKVRELRAEVDAARADADRLRERIEALITAAKKYDGWVHSGNLRAVLDGQDPFGGDNLRAVLEETP